MKPKIVSIGVYGFTEEGFFRALTNAGVDTFCDIRQRRGMRGPKYAFVNSSYLQEKLKELGIKYFHAKELAPTDEVRNYQHQEDEKSEIAKRDRATLSPAFISAYKNLRLSGFKSERFIEQYGEESSALCIFCVEREYSACHRSLVINKLVNDLGLDLEKVPS